MSLKFVPAMCKFFKKKQNGFLPIWNGDGSDCVDSDSEMDEGERKNQFSTFVEKN